MKNVKKLLSLLLVAATLLLLAIPASAASIDLNNTAREALPNLSNISIQTYGKNTSGRIYAYTNEYLQARTSGWIDLKCDACKITKVANNGAVLWVTYPIGGGRTTARWFSAAEFLGVNMASKWPVVTVTKNMTTYKRINGGGTYGYTAAGDKIYVVKENSNSDYTCIIYPLSAGGYKLGYVRTREFNSSVKTIGSGQSSDMVDVTRSFHGKKVTIQSVQNGKYLCADTDRGGRALFNKSWQQTWETFSVSVTADGWAGFLCHNGKWLSALKNNTNVPISACGNNLYQWECFKIYKKGDTFYLKSQTNGKFLCVRVDRDNAPAECIADTPYGWEQLIIKPVGEPAPVAEPTFTYPMKDFHKKYRQWGVYGGVEPRPCHAGVDFMSDSDPRIYAIADGTVVSCGWNNANGRYIQISHVISGKTVYSFYGHLSTCAVKRGDTVHAGSVIGTVGKTGNSANGITHLHFGITDQPTNTGDVLGYVGEFSGNVVTYRWMDIETTYYDPYYVIEHKSLP